MPCPLPDVVAQSIAKEMPRTHEMFWLRGLVMGVEPIERPPFVSELFFTDKNKGRPATDTRVSIFDIDTGEGWDVRLTFEHDIAVGDLVSLFGHEKVGENRLSVPRLLYNHNTATYARTYRNISSMFGTVITEIDYKYSLSCRLPGTLANRVKDIKRKFHAWFLAKTLPPKIRLRNYLLAVIPSLYLASVVLRLLAVLVNPLVLLSFLPDLVIGLAMLLGCAMTVMLFMGLKLRHLFSEPPRFQRDVEYSLSELCGFSNLVEWLRYVYWDITPAYEDAARGVAAWVCENPDAEAEFIAPPVRGTGKKGEISKRNVPALPENDVKRLPAVGGDIAPQPP